MESITSNSQSEQKHQQILDHQDKEANMQILLSGVEELPSLPVTFIKILKLARSSETSLKDFVNVISYDQAMVVRVLRASNSALYGLRNKVTSVDHAASILGVTALQSIAASQAASGILNQELKGYGLDAGELFRHSVVTAVASRLIAEVKHRSIRDMAFTAGLLHDVGKLILANNAASAFAQISALARHKQISFDLAEQEILGFNHTELGKKIAEKWELSDNLVAAIEFHHNPQACQHEDKVLAHIVHLADCISMMLGIGVGLDGINYTLHNESMTACGLTDEGFNEVTERVLEEYEEALQVFATEDTA